MAIAFDFESMVITRADYFFIFLDVAGDESAGTVVIPGFFLFLHHSLDQAHDNLFLRIETEILPLDMAFKPAQKFIFIHLAHSGIF